MLRIRLTRVGKKKQPAYRIVVADSHAPRDGAFLKIIGHYNPLTAPVTLVVKEDEAVRWLQQGAQPSETAAKLLTGIGVMERAGRAPVKYAGKDVPPAPKGKVEVPAPAAAPAPAAPAPAPAPVPEATPAETAPAEAQATPAPVAAAPAPAPVAEAPAPEPETAPAGAAPAEAEAAAEPEAPAEG